MLEVSIAVRRVGWGVVLFFLTVSQTFALDPLFTGEGTVAERQSIDSDGCRGGVRLPLTLIEAEQLALCTNPKGHAAWARVMQRANEIGVARSAYLPTVSASIQSVHDATATRVDNQPLLSRDLKARYQADSLSLNWVLFDFGVRGAALDQAKALLTASQQDDAAQLQTTLLNTARDYYGTLAGYASVRAARDAEAIAQQSLEIASARLKGGVAPISEQLQAQTALAQATFNRIKAEGDADTFQGALALDIGIAPDQPLQLVPMPDSPHGDMSFVKSTQQLLIDAARLHPSILSARANLAAAEANVDLVRAQGRPTLSLVSKLARNTQPVNQGLGEPNLNANMHERYIGLQLDVPLFEGFGRLYRVKSAEAQVDEQRGSLEDAEQQVAHDVWRSEKALETATANLRSARETRDTARAALASAQRRYRLGITGIVEMLQVQNTLSQADQQQIASVANWYLARLQLAESVGSLNILMLSDE
ncbi:outer membrane protein [Paludibacterium purpuratum]|uniref:Protein CyaE n=2 Tax=Paludibacterium purpuratum TaxID=1144873 RepID=A0A4R7B378_9NEIS|nr:outer membrane protein [Paludibacterium purpuratum]